VSIEDTKKKIAFLLNKAENTDNEHERDTFNAAAEKMMLRLGIDRAELESVGEAKPEDIVKQFRTWTTIYAPAMNTFTCWIADGYGDLTCLQTRRGKDLILTHIIGHESDVAEFLVLLDSLNLQVWEAVRRFRKEYAELRRFHTIHENFVADRSFIQSFALAVSNRLAAERKEVSEDITPGTALVLASKQSRVDAQVALWHPTMKKSNKGRSSQWNGLGSQAGHEAGKKAKLKEDKAITGARRAIGG
jgi:hypothetical protein